MEDGNIKTSGSFTELEKSGINFIGEWQTNDEAYKGRTARERWQLIRLVSRIGQQLKQRNLNNEVWGTDQVVNFSNLNKCSLLHYYFMLFFIQLRIKSQVRTA